jgi:hypothetical protein
LKPQSQKEALDSLKLMRFLVVKDVPGVKEMQAKIYDKIFNFPRISKENPHLEMKSYRGRFDLYTYLTLSEGFNNNDEKDSDELKEFKSLT